MKTVVFDFDGVINSYKSGWVNAWTIPDPPVEGVKEEIAELRKTHKVIVVSTRCTTPQGTEAVVDYLVQHDIHVDGVFAEKPPAVAYVDDRAILFNGIAKGLAGRVRDFKNWLEKTEEDFTVICNKCGSINVRVYSFTGILGDSVLKFDCLDCGADKKELE